MSDLDIIIPAYKVKFLDRTLSSLAQQDLQGVRIIVSDDASPDNVSSVVEIWRNRLPLEYQRFPENLGRHHLTAHWDRSVRLGTAPWVWMLGDDDEVELGCVSAFRAALVEDADSPHDLYRFNVMLIDAESREMRARPTHPRTVSVLEQVQERFKGTLASTAPEYLFSRLAWEKNGGFVSFPLAWCSDDATWVRIGARQGIRTIEGPRVRFRMSGLNISSGNVGLTAQKAIAATQFVDWITQEANSGSLKPAVEDPALLRRHAVDWLMGCILGYLGAQGGYLNASRASFTEARGWRGEWVSGFLRGLRSR